MVEILLADHVAGWWEVAMRTGIDSHAVFWVSGVERVGGWVGAKRVAQTMVGAAVRDVNSRSRQQRAADTSVWFCSIDSEEAGEP